MAVQLIPARSGKAAHVKKGQTVKIINTHGTQVIDTWAFVADDIAERMSMEHTRAHLDKLIPTIGDSFMTNRRNPILTIVEDTSPGVHDTLIPACDSHRYRKQFNLKEYHDNCTDNLRRALDELGVGGQEFSPTPLNVFMNIPVHEDRRTISWEKSTCKAGQYLKLRAEVDLIIAFSACPNDVTPINGWKTQEAHFCIEDA